MISYAGILSRAEKEARREATEDTEDDFVDAREDPPSPEVIRGYSRENLTGKKAVTGTDKITKTMEELHMENNALRHLTDTLSKRLHMWEVSAQSSSMALHQSLRALQSQQVSPSASTAPDARAGDLNARVKELEEMVRQNQKDMQRLEHENEKLKGVVGRYRERWEKLKEGARVRREGNGNGTGSANRSPVPPAQTFAADENADMA
jgi:regulator of replication initiation timing